jgi:hypothetical protein
MFTKQPGTNEMTGEGDGIKAGEDGGMVIVELVKVESTNDKSSSHRHNHCPLSSPTARLY